MQDFDKNFIIDVITDINIDNNYNGEKGILRVEDEGRYYDVKIIPEGVDIYPNSLIHALLWIHAPDIPEIKDLSTSVGGNTKYKRGLLSFGIILNKFDDRKPYTSASSMNTVIDGDSMYGVDGKSISVKVGDESYGVFINRNGKLIIKGLGGSIEIGKTGLMFQGNKLVKNMKNEYDTFLSKKKPWSILPNTVYTSTDNANQQVDTTFLEQFCERIQKILKI